MIENRLAWEEWCELEAKGGQESLEKKKNGLEAAPTTEKEKENGNEDASKPNDNGSFGLGLDTGVNSQKDGKNSNASGSGEKPIGGE